MSAHDDRPEIDLSAVAGEDTPPQTARTDEEQVPAERDVERHQQDDDQGGGASLGGTIAGQEGGYPVDGPPLS
ncbi:hypothetical protein INN71_06510 [Nocardioides sp. ChNu-153]|uniref:hypothetical protein n=1 Tax=unclassified Nocardioides TaxID=2615069 RepID=UPI002406C148|nr:MULTISPECIES: hypothetical protein [unclassified Nocardioides]MDF9715182.1 hypothetical protein [Nocardioides sp. ChNu-99]MDN7121039.1 hypothetical protein [Nocardioides sp. ChNu-153]